MILEQQKFLHYGFFRMQVEYIECSSVRQSVS